MSSLGGDLLERRVAVELLPEQATCLRHLPHLVGDVHGETDRAPLLRQRTRDRLLDPPRGVGRELEAHPVVELLDGANETEVPLLDEVEERHLGTRVVAGDGHDESQVRLDELALRRFVAQVLAAGQLALLPGRQQAPVADLADVELQRIVGGRARQARELARRRHLFGGDGRLVVRHVEEMLGGMALHAACIGRARAPLEG